jgi:hypothetical protein
MVAFADATGEPLSGGQSSLKLPKFPPQLLVGDANDAENSSGLAKPAIPVLGSRDANAERRRSTELSGPTAPKAKSVLAAHRAGQRGFAILPYSPTQAVLT